MWLSSPHDQKWHLDAEKWNLMELKWDMLLNGLMVGRRKTKRICQTCAETNDCVLGYSCHYIKWTGGADLLAAHTVGWGISKFLHLLNNIVTVNTEEIRGLLKLKRLINLIVSRNKMFQLNRGFRLHCREIGTYQDIIWISLSHKTGMAQEGLNIFVFGLCDPQKHIASQLFYWWCPPTAPQPFRSSTELNSAL